MPALHDLSCPKCGSERRNHLFPHSQTIEDDMPVCVKCGEEMEVVWHATEAIHKQWRGSDTVVVFKDSTGKVRYPGRSDVPTPKGYERVEIRSLSALDSFCKSHGVRSEIRDFDKGSGRSHEETH